MRILVVEDDTAVRDLLADFLTNAGYETELTADGLTALDVFSRQPDSFGLVLLDVLLPGLDGFSVCRRLRDTSDVPVIMLTALDNEDEQMAGFDLLIDDYVTKPFPATGSRRAWRPPPN